MHWCVAHWKGLGLAAQAKSRRDVDSRVMRILENPELRYTPGPETAAGIALVRSAEIAQALFLDTHAVNDSLRRLELGGQVRSATATLDDPALFWHTLHW
jgi:hypothetical protein